MKTMLYRYEKTCAISTFKSKAIYVSDDYIKFAVVVYDMDCYSDLCNFVNGHWDIRSHSSWLLIHFLYLDRMMENGYPYVINISEPILCFQLPAASWYKLWQDLCSYARVIIVHSICWHVLTKRWLLPCWPWNIIKRRGRAVGYVIAVCVSLLFTTTYPCRK